MLMVVYLPVGVRFLPLWSVISVEIILAVFLIWSLAFFRDPYRVAPLDKDIVLAPADGTITDIETVEQEDFIGGAAVRIGIFMSIFNVHINRAPCDVKIHKITYKKGQYKNAMNPASGRVNESNDVAMVRTNCPEDKLIVRQISGAIARRIVCKTGEGEKLSGGEKFGMIKFGSRTELYVPVREDVKCMVQTGDKVEAGLSVLVRYDKCQD